MHLHATHLIFLCHAFGIVQGNVLPQITDTPQKRDNTVSDGPLTIVAADGGGNSKGDIEIDLSGTASNAMNDFFHKGKCQAAQKRGLDLSKRDPTVVDCLLNNAQDIVNAMGLNGVLNALVLPATQVAQNFPFPEFADPDYAAAFGEFAVWAGDAIPIVIHGIAQPQVIPATIFVYLLAVADYGQTFFQTRKLFLQAKSLLTDKEFALICPSQDSKFYPSCGKWICSGQNGKCTSDLMKPCPCADTSANCPTDFSKVSFCSQCNGADNQCTTGDSKGCDCIEDGEINAVGPDPADWLDTQQQLLGMIGEYIPGSERTTSTCDTTSISKIIYDEFSPGVWRLFCNAVDKDAKTALSQIVDISGNVIPPKKSRGLVDKKPPPPKPGAFLGYTFALTWTGGDGSCLADCGSAYSNIVISPCGHQGSRQNLMVNAATLDTGCGTYSYSIAAPPPPETTTVALPPPKTTTTDTPPPAAATPSVGPVACNPYLDSYSGCWNDIHSDSVDSCANAMAAQISPARMTASSKNETQVLREGASGGQGGNGVTYMMNIGWIPGCTVSTSQAADNPLGVSGDSTISYTTLIRNTYSQCTGNNGLGGFVDVGCLRYGFYPSNINGIFGSPPNPELFWQANMNICG